MSGTNVAISMDNFRSKNLLLKHFNPVRRQVDGQAISGILYPMDI